MKNSLPLISPRRFLGICFLSIVLVNWLPESVLAPLNRATASLSGLFLSLFGRNAEVAGDIIRLDGFRVQIVTECTPIYCVILYGAFLFSVPASRKTRLTGLATGIAFLGSVNVARIAAVTAIGAKSRLLFEIIHVYLGQVVMLLLVVAASFVWYRWATRSVEMKALFILRTLALASVIFLPWLILNETYVKAQDTLTRGIFALAGYRLFIPYGRAIYFQTFNTVLLLGMVFADRSIPVRLKAVWAVSGVTILPAWQLLFRVGNVLLTAFSWQPALPLTISISVIGEYLLPLMLWFAATHAFGTIKER
jgi:exosortase H (IPTLxxWG-CTERM-specific)